MSGKHVKNNCYVEYKCPECGEEYEEEWKQATDYDCYECDERMISNDVHFCGEVEEDE